MEKKCFYCFNIYSKDTEHVFPDGLGGERLYMNCVCEKCNNDFSKLERDLYQNGIPALNRSIEGLASQKKQNKPNYFKAPILLTFDEENQIVYEVNQNNELIISLKPQIIEINSKFYLEGSSEKDVERFISNLKRWKKDSLKLVLKFPNNKSNYTSYIQFKIYNNKVLSKKEKSSNKIENSIIAEILDNHELSKYLKPRIFLDNENNLRLRAKSIEESINFVKLFLIFISRTVKLRSFSRKTNDNGIVYVGQKFNSLKKEQAMVKILLNCLIYYFPKSKNSKSLEKVKSFIKNKGTGLKRSVEQKSKIIDSIEKSHNVFFYQYENNINLRLSLFNGQTCYSIIIENLKILPNMDYNRLVVDFKKRKHKLQSKSDFLMSFNT